MERTIDIPDLIFDVNIEVHDGYLHIGMVAKSKINPSVRYYKSTDIYAGTKLENFLFGDMEKRAKNYILKFVNKCVKKYPKDLIKQEKKDQAYIDNLATAKKVLNDQIHD